MRVIGRFKKEFGGGRVNRLVRRIELKESDKGEKWLLITTERKSPLDSRQMKFVAVTYNAQVKGIVFTGDLELRIKGKFKDQFGGKEVDDLVQSIEYVIDSGGGYYFIVTKGGEVVESWAMEYFAILIGVGTKIVESLN